MKPALVLSGGGARGAYQVGVLKAVADLHVKKARNPFSIISGTSTGAINAVALAASANNFRLAVKKVEAFWRRLHVDQVYKATSWDLMVSVSILIASFFNDGVGRNRPLALLNNDPLRQLLIDSIQFKNIQKRIDAGYLDAVAVNATGYTSGESVTFFQGHSDLNKWRRNRRVGIPTTLGVEHLMASSAIPTIFPAEKVSREYFGDGALRQLAPISPVLKMGADRVMVIGVSANPVTTPHREMATHSPSLAQMVGHLFNSAFIDSIEHDLDMLVRFNDLIGMTENENPYTFFGEMRKVPLLAIYPTVEFDHIAANHIQDLPWAMRRFMKNTGATDKGGGASFASYLLFESGFCKELIDCGYRDAMEQEQAIIDFFKD
ncbi:MAG: patatin-like phospholipase family protein [Pseudomonadales bacterium]|nr:patatin-like phospholipase family protein [Pseudomonadales bacterium]